MGSDIVCMSICRKPFLYAIIHTVSLMTVETLPGYQGLVQSLKKSPLVSGYWGVYMYIHVHTSGRGCS